MVGIDNGGAMTETAKNDSSDLAQIKVAARKAASAARKAAKQAAGDKASQSVADAFVRSLKPASGAIVSGFLPIGSEIDVLPALEAARGAGCKICLPCVIAPAQPLVFRLWSPGDPLVTEAFGTKAPADSAPAVAPDILIVPMLAFDRAGYRLGYGGGFYDRSLEALRRTKPVTAVGIAFAGQEVDIVPRGVYDQPLDWIVTEAGAFRPAGEE